MANPSEETHMLSAFILEGVLLIVIGIIGIGGNLAGIVIFSRKRKIQRNFHALMLSLSVFDLAYIVVSILIFSLPQFSDSYLTSGVYFYVLPVALPFAQIGLTGGIYFTIAITVERYFTVCHPFFRVSHSWPAKYYVVPISSFALLYNIPKFLEIKTQVTPVFVDEFGNRTVDINGTLTANSSSIDVFEYSIAPTMLRQNQYYFQIYCMWLNFLLMGVGPFVVLIVLNTLMLIRLKKMVEEKARENLSSPPNRYRLSTSGAPNRASQPQVTVSQAKEVILAKVSLGIVFVFIVCHSIKWIPNIFELMQVGSNAVEWPQWVETTTNLSHLMTTFNSSVNFFIYLAKHYHSKRRNQRAQTFCSAMNFSRTEGTSLPLLSCPQPVMNQIKTQAILEMTSFINAKDSLPTFGPPESNLITSTPDIDLHNGVCE